MRESSNLLERRRYIENDLFDGRYACLFTKHGNLPQRFKNSNLFLLQNSEVRLIDIWESKEYLLDEDNNPATMDTKSDQHLNNCVRFYGKPTF
jgi:hypothetical protein